MDSDLTPTRCYAPTAAMPGSPASAGTNTTTTKDMRPSITMTSNLFARSAMPRGTLISISKRRAKMAMNLRRKIHCGVLTTIPESNAYAKPANLNMRNRAAVTPLGGDNIA